MEKTRQSYKEQLESWLLVNEAPTRFDQSQQSHDKEI